MSRVIVALCAVPAMLFPQPNVAVERAKESVAIVLAGKGQGGEAQLGGAVVVRPNGVLLTAYRLVQAAATLQVRFRSGEVFDHVELLGVDRRRGVAAIKIPAERLKPLPLSEHPPERGGAVTVVSHGAGINWNASTGFVSDIRLADTIGGAGSGYKLIESTIPALVGSVGGMMIDANGNAVGILIAASTAATVTSFAIPLADVVGLADSSPTMTFASAVAQSGRKEAVATPAAPEKSESLSGSKSRGDLLRTFKTMYVDAEKAKYFKSDQMKAALGRNREFESLDIRIVDDRRVADTVLVVGYTFAWDFPFELKHQNTTTVLAAGKGVGPFSGPVGAASVASEFVKTVKPHRHSQPEKK